MPRVFTLDKPPQPPSQCQSPPLQRATALRDKYIPRLLSAIHNSKSAILRDHGIGSPAFGPFDEERKKLCCCKAAARCFCCAVVTSALALPNNWVSLASLSRGPQPPEGSVQSTARVTPVGFVPPVSLSPLVITVAALLRLLLLLSAKANTLTSSGSSRISALPGISHSVSLACLLCLPAFSLPAAARLLVRSCTHLGWSRA